MADERGQSWLQKIGNVRELNVLGFVVIAGILISFLNPTFLTLFNLQVIARQLAVFGILAIAETFVIIALGIELSVGSMVAFSGIIAALIITKTGSLLLVIIGVPLMSAIIGSYHGFMVTRLSIAPFIVTLGSLSMLRGAAFVISRGYPILVADERFRWIGQGLIGPLPVPLVILIIVALFCWFILRYTILGRYIYAIGGNPEASRMSGVPVRRVLLFVYVQATVLASIVGLIVAGRMAEGLASVAVGYELTAIAAAVIGGTSFLGGIGSIPGVVLGALLMGMIDNAMITLRVDPYWYNLVTGVIIIMAVVIDVLRSKKQEG